MSTDLSLNRTILDTCLPNCIIQTTQVVHETSLVGHDHKDKLCDHFAPRIFCGSVYTNQDAEEISYSGWNSHSSRHICTLYVISGEKGNTL